MNDKCQKCKHYRNDSHHLKIEGMSRVGDYCIKFQWNLAGMTKIPGDCYE